jgi:precorrin-3B synthase
MNAPLRRGSCPSLSQPMPTGDGLLVRITPTGATISCAAFAALCAAAHSCGNGIIEVTSRGSIQIRGLTEASSRQLAAAVGRIDGPFCQAPAVSSNALSGLDPDEAFDTSAIAAELRRALAAAAFSADIAPKISITLDGGGALHLDAVAADVRMRAEAGGTCLHVAVAGDAESATPLGAITTEHAVEAAVAIVRAIAAAGPTARARDILAANGAAAFREAIAGRLVDLPRPPRRPPAEPIGVHALRDGNVAIGLGLAFGHSHASALGELARTAAASGTAGFRTAPLHALMIVGLPPHSAAPLADMAQRLGFVVHASDPRRRVIACAGAPVCAAAEIATRTLAHTLAVDIAIPGANAPVLHLSGCAKGCACARATPLTVVGVHGRCGVVVNGSARDAAVAMLLPEALPGALSRVTERVRRVRAANESVAQVLSRLDREEIVQLMLGEARDG